MVPTDEEAATDKRARDLKTLMDDYERGLIMAALGAADGQQTKAAALLGVLPTTLHEKIKRLGLHRTFGSEPAPGSREVLLPETTGEFRWRGALGAGSTLELRGTIGDVRVHGVASDVAEVVAVRSAGSGNGQVAVHVLEHSDGLVVSARHHKPAAADDALARERAASVLVRLRVEFELRVPVETNLHIRLFAGDITVLGVAGRVEAHTTSGTVRIA